MGAQIGRQRVLTSAAGLGGDLDAQAWRFTASRKTATFSHRTVAPSVTEARVRSIAARVPITRVSDLTPLDPLGLPVFSVTTPLARDLTTHMGKGLNADTARVSALMEAVERVSAEMAPAASVRATFDELVAAGCAAVDPADFDLPSDTSFRRDRPVSWIKARDLLSDETVFVACDLAINPPPEGVLQDVDTNGLAAGNTVLEAVVHGLCEVIERDAVGTDAFRMAFADRDEHERERRLISQESLPKAALCLIAAVEAAGHRIHVELLNTDVGVPTFRSQLVDDGYPGHHGCELRMFIGFGTSPSAETAVLRSITEAVQSRLAVVQGARDSYNSLSSPLRAPVGPSRLVPFDSVPTFVTDDLLEDLRYLLGRLRRAGAERVLAVDLTRPEFGIPVVRVRVPRLTSFIVNRRRVGWRCLRYLL